MIKISLWRGQVDANLHKRVPSSNTVSRNWTLADRSKTSRLIASVTEEWNSVTPWNISRYIVNRAEVVLTFRPRCLLVVRARLLHKKRFYTRPRWKWIEGLTKPIWRIPELSGIATSESPWVWTSSKSWYCEFHFTWLPFSKLVRENWAWNRVAR